MTPHQALAVVVRLFAIWLALAAARELIGVYVAGRERGDAYVLPVVAAVSILAALFVLALWFFPKSIARGLLPLASDAPAKPSGPELWFAAGAGLIGVWLAASALPGLARNLFVMYLFRAESVDRSGLVPGIVYLLVQLAVAAALILGANGIRRLVWWARHAGPD
jgi:hypothetical protein